MSHLAIRVHGLSKQYRIGGKQERYRTLRDTLADAAMAPFRRIRSILRGHGAGLANSDSTIWALKDVSFEVKRGEVVGIIGRNGAGKSTLLKILSRITEPTEGYAEVNGRVGSLLEVGTGFHPELTGRENIYLNGAILGMKRADIESKFDEIVAFSEVEKFIDTPVKHYSSGMYLRLAFAVAAHLEPEILLVDEVLAVGDAAFQKKCLGKMGDVAQEGRTVLFVSHSMASVASLCQSAMLLETGSLRRVGTPHQIVQEYLTSFSSMSAEVNLRDCAERRGRGEARIVRASILDSLGRHNSTFNYGDDVCFTIEVEQAAATPDLLCCVEIRTALGTPVLHLVSLDDPEYKPFKATGSTLVHCLLNNIQLYPGLYIASFWIGPNVHSTSDYVSDALAFRVEQGNLLRRGFEMSWTKGVFHCETRWRVRPITPMPLAQDTLGANVEPADLGPPHRLPAGEPPCQR